MSQRVRPEVSSGLPERSGDRKCLQEIGVVRAGSPSSSASSGNFLEEDLFICFSF